MGYTTEFSGAFKLSKKLDGDTHKFLVKLSETRRMKRKMSAVYGIDGEFFVDAKGFAGQNQDDNSIIDYNTPPSTQPGLWCQWRPTDDGKSIEWDGGEKFYCYVEWMNYIIKNFLEPNDIKVTGQIKFSGEDRGDRGTLKIVDGRCVAVRK